MLPRLRAPGRLDVASLLGQELDLARLSSVYSWLWVAGRPTPPRPLHHQLVLGREVLVAERMDMHLVWTGGLVFLKPLPRYLLEPAFWREHLSCPRGCLHGDVADVADAAAADASGRAARRGQPAVVSPCRRAQWRRALGFLYSYAALVSYESDFRIARERHLLPDDLDWPGWRAVARRVLERDGLDRQVDPRFIYGELRLSRLNKIFLLSGRSVLRGYMPRWQQYGSYFRDNLAWLASATVYIAIVLTAMQLGLATSLADNDAFKSASYGFTIFSILGPLVAATMIFLVFILMFVDNLVEAVRFKKRRFHEVQGQLATY